MNNENRYRQENELQKQAFEMYYGLGLKRTYAAVAKAFEKSISTIKNWSRAFGWRQRIEQRNAARTQLLGESAHDDVVEQTERWLKLVEVAEAWTMKYLAEGRTKPTVKELVSLIEARLALDGMLDEESDEKEPPVDLHMVLVDRDK